MATKRFGEYDPPTAFSKQFPKIKRHDDVQTLGAIMDQDMDHRMFKMGKIFISLTLPKGNRGFFLSITGKDRYPTWDEIVWIKYNLLPDAAYMSMALPNLRSYINQEDTGYKYVFTLDQKGWALDPVPSCECGYTLSMVEIHDDGMHGDFQCDKCFKKHVIDMTTWNELHGVGIGYKRELWDLADEAHS